MEILIMVLVVLLLAVIALVGAFGCWVLYPWLLRCIKGTDQNAASGTAQAPGGAEGAAGFRELADNEADADDDTRVELHAVQ